MILVDREIKELVKKNMLIIKGYNEENVGAVSYDLTISKIQDDNESDEYTLHPNEFIIIKTNEEINIPNNMIGHIKEKNSLLRLGLMVNGPMYQPGHKTYCFLRVYNMSKKDIILKKNFNIAQIVFETLDKTPDTTYNNNENSSFNNETDYLKYGKYNETYTKITK